MTLGVYQLEWPWCDYVFVLFYLLYFWYFNLVVKLNPWVFKSSRKPLIEVTGFGLLKTGSNQQEKQQIILCFYETIKTRLLYDFVANVFP